MHGVSVLSTLSNPDIREEGKIKVYDNFNTGRCEGSVADPSRKRPHRMGRKRYAGPAPDPRPLRKGSPTAGHAHVWLLTYYDRDGQPGDYLEGRWRRSGAVRLQSAVDTGRCGGGAGERVRHPHLCDQGRG